MVEDKIEIALIIIIALLVIVFAFFAFSSNPQLNLSHTFDRSTWQSMTDHLRSP
jgi:hypothetical protein